MVNKFSKIEVFIKILLCLNENNEDLVSIKATKPWWKIIFEIPNILLSLNGEKNIDLTQEENGQNTTEWVMPIKFASPGTSIGAFQVHFENATSDINLSSLIADTNPETKKSILYMSKWPEEVEVQKILFIPKR